MKESNRVTTRLLLAKIVYDEVLFFPCKITTPALAAALDDKKAEEMNARKRRVRKRSGERKQVYGRERR